MVDVDHELPGAHVRVGEHLGDVVHRADGDFHVVQLLHQVATVQLEDRVGHGFHHHVAMLDALYAHLQALKPGRTFDVEPFVGDVFEVLDAWRDLHLLTAKSAIYCCNVDESMADGKTDNVHTLAVREHAKKEGAPVVAIRPELVFVSVSLPLENVLVPEVCHDSELVLLNVVLRLLPRPAKAAIAAIAMSAAIKPYSIAVAPVLLRRSFLKSCIVVSWFG
mgnify:CR=1 FL=1